MNFKNAVLSFILLVAVLNITSCKKEKQETTTPGDETVAETQNDSEKRVITTMELEQGLMIQGAEVIPGSAPAPNSDLDFQMDDEPVIVLQNTGFEIDFSSSVEIAGAYIVLKDANGNKTSSYLDIPKEAFDDPFWSKSAELSSNKKGTLNLKSAKTESDYQINVDFSTTLKPGSFCYGICVYDSENNVSQARNVCVEIEAWGGNASLVGKWELYKSDYTDDDEGYTETIYCQSGQSFEASYEKNYNADLIIQFSEDGSFSLDEKETGEELDWEQSYEKCKAIYYSYTYKATVTGSWAYNETNKFLGLVGFEETYVEDGETETYQYEEGEEFAGLYVEIIGNELVLSEQYVEDGITYTDRYYFKRI